MFDARCRRAPEVASARRVGEMCRNVLLVGGMATVILQQLTNEVGKAAAITKRDSSGYSTAEGSIVRFEVKISLRA